ncbi:MAG TPA: glycosyltransferase family 39 protein, partial [Thermodesulfobacteriota bacterium]
RARLNTYLTAGAFTLFGESEGAARVPALLFGIGTMALVYAVGLALFGPVAGVVALALVALSADAVDVSRFARLYSPLTFFALLAAFATYRAVEGRGEGPRPTAARGRWLALAAAAGLLATHLHPIALALGPSLLAYATLRFAALAVGGRRTTARPYAWLGLALAVAAAVALLLPSVRGRLAEAALTPLPWYEPKPGDAWTYHADLAARYTWLWFLVWPASVLAALAWPRAGLFVACAFWVPFVVLSVVVATKQPRYAVHLLPLAWLLLGAAAEVLWPRVRAVVLAQGLRLVPDRLKGATWLPPVLLAAVLALALAPVLRTTPAVADALRRHTKTTGRFTTGHYQEWRDLAAQLGPRLPADARIVSTTWHAPIYYLHRPTNHLLPAFRERGEGDWETPTRDPRPQVQTAEDLDRLLATGRAIWVITRRSSWERPGYLDAGFTRAVETRCRRQALPAHSSFAAFDCGRRAGGD